jgi:EAL domain-containing protein (putative c-di-GMP-specific phosphodiesterase class I)
MMSEMSSRPSNFVPLDGMQSPACGDCREGVPLGFSFDFAFQPVVDVSTHAVVSHEALVRGPAGEGAHSVLSQVDADNRYRFDQACRVKAIKTATALGLSTRLSINFLPNAVYKPELCIRTTIEAARAHGLPLDRIVFEVTEGERVEDGPWFAEILREYQRCGFLTAIDDFGAGYAGLRLLSDFQPDIVKLDMDLVRGIDTLRPRQAIVRHVARLAEDLGVAVIAEGIETPAERDCLLDLGVHLHQGWLYARPAFQALPPVDAAAWPTVRP